MIQVSQRVAANCARDPERIAWLSRLPDTVETVQQKWALQVGEMFDSEDVSCAWVAPVTCRDRTAAVLKIGMPHMEAEHEEAGLRFWNGEPTVRLLRYDEETRAMLLERCEPGTSLKTFPEPQQDIVLAGLLGRLWRAPEMKHAFRPLTEMLECWANETLEQRPRWSDSALVREGLRLMRELPRNASREVVLATDLHAGNVLAAQREPWLVIDPKPFVGDPAYDATQHLLNCEEELRSDPQGKIRRFADLLGLEFERVRLWMFARLAAEPRDDWRNDRRTMLARAVAP